MACSNCGVTSALSTKNRKSRSHQEDMTSFLQPLVFDNTVTVLQGLEDVFDLTIDLNKSLEELQGRIPQLCGFCTYLLAQAHQARCVFLKRSREDSYVIKLLTPDDVESPKPKKRKRKRSHENSVEIVKQEPEDLQEELSDMDFDNSETLEIEMGESNNDDEANSSCHKCSHCNKSFVSSAALNKHWTSTHDVDYEPPPGPSKIPSQSRPRRDYHSDTSDEDDGSPPLIQINMDSQGTVLKTQRNKDLFVFDGYAYRFERAGNNGKRFWECNDRQKRKCYGRLRTIGDNDNITIAPGGNLTHNHSRDLTTVKMIEIRNKVKDMANLPDPLDVNDAVTEALRSTCKLPVPINIKAVLRQTFLRCQRKKNQSE